MNQANEEPATYRDDPTTQTEPPAKVDPLVIQRRHDETEAGAIARYAVKPEVSAGLTIQKAKRSNLFPIEITPLADVLAEQTKAVNSGDLAHGETMLSAQAATLDALFHKLVQFGLQNMQQGYGDAAERYMRLGFKAQAQCRNNWETLNEIKNPRPLAFIKQQTNVAGGHQRINQQINTGIARESESPPTELNGQTHEQTMDTGSTTPAIGIDPAVAAVGTINGPAIAQWQSDVIAEPIPRCGPTHAARARKATKRS